MNELKFSFGNNVKNLCLVLSVIEGLAANGLLGLLWMVLNFTNVFNPERQCIVMAKKKTFYISIAWVRVSVLLLTNCVIWGKLLKWPLPKFSHPQNKNNNSTYLLSLLWILNKLTRDKCLKMSMAYSKSSVSVNHHYLEERARTWGVQRIKDILVERIGTYKVTVVESTRNVRGTEVTACS